MNKDETHKVLKGFGDYIVKQSRSNLTRGGKNVSKSLYDSIAAKTKVSKNSFQFDVEMELHGLFVDKGVKGKTSSERAPNSPYKFGSGKGKKGGLTDAINAWVRRKGINFKNEKGKKIGVKATAQAIIRSTYQKGIKPTNFFTKPFEAGFKKLPDELLQAYGLDVESMLKISLANGSKEI